ncbi:SIR2 family NAD-dependent protein deacylase [Paenibacillus polymyxa]|uniref:SIR2 family NAD-dependent protein deacylase n=1 Tax=Paenibacillus polymyxa TaxID=1406 RepID=UPI003D27455F
MELMTTLDIQQIAKLLLNKKNRTGTGVVFILGAGFSMRDTYNPAAKGLGSGWEVSKFLGDKLQMKNIENLQRTAEYYEVVFGKQALIQEVKEYLKSRLVVQESHRYLARLMHDLGDLKELVFTVNYDNLLESCYKQEYEKDLEVWRKGESYTSQKHLYKIHGCITSENHFVLTSEDYYNVKSDENLMKTLYSIFRDNTCVFIGFSMEDQDLMDILFNIRKLNDVNSFLKHYLVVPLEGINENRMKYLSEKINVRHVPMTSEEFLANLIAEYEKKNKDDQINGYLLDSINTFYKVKKEQGFEEYPNEMVTIQLIQRCSLIKFEIEHYCFLILFSQFHRKNYKQIFKSIPFDNTIDLCKYYEHVFLPSQSLQIPISNNLISVFLSSIFDETSDLSLDHLTKVTNLLCETSISTYGAEQELYNLFTKVDNNQKLKLLSLVLENKYITSTYLLSTLESINVDIGTSEFNFYVVKSIVNCFNKKLLLELSAFFNSGILKEIINLRICILTFDVKNMRLINNNFEARLKPFVNQINSEASFVQEKMASLWTSPYYDATNSVNSSYALSEDVRSPEILKEGEYIKSQLIIGKEYGCILSTERNLVVINLESGLQRKLNNIGNVLLGPIFVENSIGIATNDEISLYNIKGDLLQTEFLIGEEVVSLKPKDKEIIGLTNMGRLFFLNDNSSFSFVIPEKYKKERYTDVLVFNSFFVFVGEGCIQVFKRDKNRVADFVEEIKLSTINKVLGINDVCFIITAHSILRWDLSVKSDDIVKYDLMIDFHDNPIVVETPNTLIIASNERIIRIIFNASEATHKVVFSEIKRKAITDIIRCNGLYAVLTIENNFFILKNLDDSLETTSKLELMENSDGYRLSCGYGALYITSNRTIYVIKNREAVIIDEHVA